MYVIQDPRVQAMTLGVDKPFVVLTTGLLDLMDAEELRLSSGTRSGTCCPGTRCTGRCSSTWPG